MSDELAEKIFQRASNLGVTASTRYEGASTGEAVTELVQMAGGDAGVLKQASDMCDQALSTAPDNLDIKRGCELLSAAVDEAGSG